MAACACVTCSGVRSAGHGFADVGAAAETELLDIKEVLDATCVLDDDGGLVAAAELVEVLLAEDEPEGPASDEVQPAKLCAITMKALMIAIDRNTRGIRASIKRFPIARAKGSNSRCSVLDIDLSSALCNAPNPPPESCERA